MGHYLRVFAVLPRQLLKPSPSPPIGLRYIKKWVRPTLLVLRGRKKVEEIKYPKPPTPRHAFSDWNYNSEIYAFAKRLNEEFDDSLLRQALTEKSYVIKEMKRQEEVGLDTSVAKFKDNSYMALEGMVILRNTIQSYLSRELPLLPKVGVESVCNYLVSEPVLAHVSSHIGTKDLILCDEYPPSDATFANTFQAIVSALEKSSGKSRAEKFILDFVVTQLSGKDINEVWDIPKPWTMLTNILGEKGDICEPRLIRESGRNSVTAVFVIGIYNVKKDLIGTGIGETLDIAQEMAARDALKGLFGTKESRRSFKFA